MRFSELYFGFDQEKYHRLQEKKSTYHTMLCLFTEFKYVHRSTGQEMHYTLL